jgi:hypothetical protein
MDSELKNTGHNSLEKMLCGLTASVVEQKNCLDRHTAAMETLAQAVRQLEATIKSQFIPGSRQSSPRVDNLIRSLIEYEINPRYYYKETRVSQRDTRSDFKGAILALPGSQ